MATNNDKLAEMAQKIAELEAANERLRTAANKPQRLSLKVSEKGAISLYGTGRFPTTLYAEQWEIVLGHGEVIKAFIKEARAAGKVVSKAEKISQSKEVTSPTGGAPRPAGF